MAKWELVPDYPIGPSGPSADVDRPAPPRGGKWEPDANYDLNDRPGARVVPVHPAQAQPPSALAILLRAAGALNDAPPVLDNGIGGVLNQSPGQDNGIGSVFMPARPPAPTAPVGPAPPQPPSPVLDATRGAFANTNIVPANPLSPMPVIGPAFQPFVPTEPVAPPTPPVNDDFFGRVLRAALEASPAGGVLTPEEKERTLAIFRLNADRAWRENTLAGNAVSNIESGATMSPAELAKMPAGSTGPHLTMAPNERTRRASAFEGDPADPFNTPEAMRATPEGERLRARAGQSRWSAMPIEGQRRMLDEYLAKRESHEANREEKRRQTELLGPMSTADEAAAVVSSLVGAAGSPEVLVGPAKAAISGASTVGKALRFAGTNAAVVGATDPIAQESAVARGDKKEYSPAEHALATAGAAVLGGAIPLLGALFRRFGVLRGAPHDAEVPPTRESVPPVREGAPPRADAPPETPSQFARPQSSEAAGVRPETVQPEAAPAARPVPPNEARPEPPRAPAAEPPPRPAPDAPPPVRIVGMDGAPSETGFVAAERGLPARFATKAEAEQWMIANAERLPAHDRLEREFVAGPHPSGEGYAVAARRAPTADVSPPARPEAPRQAQPDRPATPDVTLAEARPTDAAISSPHVVRTEIGPDGRRYGFTAESPTGIPLDDARPVPRGAAPPDHPATPREGAPAESPNMLRRGEPPRQVRGVADEMAASPPRGTFTAAEQAATLRSAPSGLVREPGAAPMHAGRGESVSLPETAADARAAGYTFSKSSERFASGASHRFVVRGPDGAETHVAVSVLNGEKSSVQAVRDEAWRLARERLAPPERPAPQSHAAPANEPGARPKAEQPARPVNEPGARPDVHGEARSTPRAEEARAALHAETGAPHADTSPHLASDRFPDGASRLSANPFGDPRLWRHVAPELVGALVGGTVGEYAETGQVGFSLKWALTGALAMSGTMRLPIKGRTLLGKDSWAMRGVEAAGDLMGRTPILRTLHPRGGVTAELWDKIQRAHVETRNMQHDAAKLAKYLRDNFSPAERALMSDWIERAEQGRYGLHGFEEASAAVRAQAEQLSRHADQIGEELVALKMLDPAAFEKLRGQYLHRYYAPHAADDAPAMRTARKQVSATYSRRRGESRPDVENAGGFKEGDSVVQMVRPDNGETRFVAPAERLRLEAEGFVHGKTWTVENVRGDKMDLHRDFSPIERQAMGEIRDANYRYTRGVMEASRDLALGRLYKSIADDPRWASATEVQGWHKVPDSNVTGSVVKKFGALGGMHVEPSVWSALMAARKPWTHTDNESLNGFVRGYLKLLGLWKIGKTAWNPATHFNNFFGNISLSMLSGVVGPGDVARAARAMLRKDGVIEEARRAGLSIGQEANLGDELGGIFRDLGGLTGIEPRGAWLRLVDWYANGPVTRLYQREDTLFKVAAYMAQRRAGASPEAAVKEAHAWYFDYRDVPIGVQFIRDVPAPVIGAPFFTYTYKVAQALGRLAIEKPHRILAAYGLLSGINLASYGFLYDHKAGASEDYERELLPEHLKGRNALGAPRALRMPWDNVDSKTGEKRPVFLDTRYFLPGGDLLDFTARSKFGPEVWPAVLGNTVLGGNPLVVGLGGAWTGKDTFSGKDIYPYPNTSLEDWRRRPTHEVAANFWALVRWTALQALPPVVTTVPDRLGNAMTGEGAIDKRSAFADWMGWTGTDFAGREKSVANTLAGVFGIKLEDMNLSEQHQFRQLDLAKDVREAFGDARRLHRNETHTESQRQGSVEAIRDRVQRGQSEMQRLNRLRDAAGR